MKAYLIKRSDGSTVGYITDELLADRLDGIEAYYDSQGSFEYEIEEVENSDIV